jgi:ubiquitin-conjugating enzyme E2 H
MASPNASRRRELDVTKLMMSDFEVHLVNESTNDMHVLFHGPSDSPYEGGSWKVHVGLPEGYPYKSPSIGFCNRIFHPNVDEMCALPFRPIPQVKSGRMT